jgi:hypothetical protein
MLLVRSSAYFAELIPDGKNDVRLDDLDVSSMAFESFLVVLSSPYVLVLYIRPEIRADL